MRAQLAPLDGGTPIEIAKDMTIVGRESSCDIRLDHKSVSKVHCILVKTDGLIVLRDLGSTNGTRVNGVRVRRAILLPNDKLSFAAFHYRVLFGAALTAAEQTDRTLRLEANDLQQVLDSAPESDMERPSLPDVYPQDEKEPHTK